MTQTDGTLPNILRPSYNDLRSADTAAGADDDDDDDDDDDSSEQHSQVCYNVTLICF